LHLSCVHSSAQEKKVVAVFVAVVAGAAAVVVQVTNCDRLNKM
jgi:hypothetical protein